MTEMTNDDYFETLQPSIQERIAEAKERDKDDGGNVILLHGFEGAMIGTVRMPDGRARAVYEEGLCLKLLMNDIRKNNPEMPEEELYMDAVDAWDYNTMRAIPYMGECAPVIIQGFDVDESGWGSLLRSWV